MQIVTIFSTVKYLLKTLNALWGGVEDDSVFFRRSKGAAIAIAAFSLYTNHVLGPTTPQLLDCLLYQIIVTNPETLKLNTRLIKLELELVSV